MNVKDIPIIIPNFNQLSYLRNIVNQIQFYYPENPIIILDNGSDYHPLLIYYLNLDFNRNEIKVHQPKINVLRRSENDFIRNLNWLLPHLTEDYYVITDPDLQIAANTPPNFLEIFKTAIDSYGFHHAGFGLITDDIPDWNPKKGWIQGDENRLLSASVWKIEHEGKIYDGHKAPIDTTFALWKRDNGGWSAPLDGDAWDNSLRMFKAFHLPWYLHKDFLNDEMKNYFATCKKREAGKPTAGQNHYNPYNGMD